MNIYLQLQCSVSSWFLTIFSDSFSFSNKKMFPHIAEEQERRQTLRESQIERRVMRENSDPFRLTDQQFIDLFRLNKEMVYFLIAELTPYMPHSANYNAVDPTIRIFVALVFFGTGTYQRVIGQSFQLSVSQQTASRAINEVCSLIIEHLGNRFIKFPQNAEEKIRIKEDFMQKTQFPGVIGAIDCTHIAIIKPNVEEHNYLNRKGFHSKNVQLVCTEFYLSCNNVQYVLILFQICDSNLTILNINARYPGSCHDAYIWRNSYICEELHHCFETGDRNSWLLGDSGYPQQPWLMTPVPNPPPGSPQERYNQRHAITRNSIERCIGVLKSRFRCLSIERKLRYSPEKAGNIATACAVLHNLCVAGNLDIPEPEPQMNNIDLHYVVPGEANGNANRLLLIERYFL